MPSTVDILHTPTVGLHWAIETQYWAIGNETCGHNSLILVYILNGGANTAINTSDVAVDTAAAQPGGSSPPAVGAGRDSNTTRGNEGDEDRGDEPRRPLDPYHSPGQR